MQTCYSMIGWLKIKDKLNILNWMMWMYEWFLHQCVWNNLCDESIYIILFYNI